MDERKSEEDKSFHKAGSLTEDDVYVTVRSDSSFSSTDGRYHPKLTYGNVCEFMEPYQKGGNGFLERARCLSEDELKEGIAESQKLLCKYGSPKEEIQRMPNEDSQPTPEKNGTPESKWRN